MCSGKSTIAREVSKKYNVPYFDIDDEVVKATGMTISKIFESYGEQYFRMVERRVLEIITDNNDNCIIACGGGLGCTSIDYLNEHGTTIYVKKTESEILERLTNDEIQKRPLLKGKNLQEYILNQLKEREQQYNKAKYIYEEDFNFEWS